LNSTPLVYSYARFSSLAQREGISLQRQADYAAEWAREHGMRLDETLVDPGRSAYHGEHVKHGHLGKFLKEIESGKVAPGSVLIVEALDRLSRAAPSKAQTLLSQIIHAGVTVVTVKDGKEYSEKSLEENPMDLLYSILLFIRSNEESVNKAKHQYDAMRAHCKQFLEGTRERVRFGHDPLWIKPEGRGRCEFDEERAAVMRVALDLYRRGHGPQAIARKLSEDGLTLTEDGTSVRTLERILKSRALIGEKIVRGIRDIKKGTSEDFTLPNHYPALLTLEQFQEIQDIGAARSVSPKKGTVASTLTGIGVVTCGYCGCYYLAQTYKDGQRDDGTVIETYRRMRCSHRRNPTVTASPLCAHSVMAEPIERAIMQFCGDLVNLRSLHHTDREEVPRAKLAAARESIAVVDKKLAALGEALEAGGAAIPTLVKRMNALEEQKREFEADVESIERELKQVARSDLGSISKQWATLIEGVRNQEHDARVKARQLVLEMFRQIAVFARGVRPNELPEGTIDLLMISRAGVERMLRIDSAGGWRVVKREDYVPETVTQPQPRRSRTRVTAE